MGRRQKRFLMDTTLRDGEQSPRINLSINQKCKLAALLDQAGFYQIEAGIPAMGSFEKETICRIMGIRKHAKISVWNRMNKKDIRHSFECQPDIIHISVPASDGMIYSMLAQNRSWVKKMMESCVCYANEHGYQVSVGFQDTSRSDPDFLVSLVRLLEDYQVSSIRLADTVGVFTPSRASALVRKLDVHTDIPLGIHTHNDLGMAEAVALDAARAGAELIDTTLFGVGERAGNCNSICFSKAAERLFDLSPTYGELEKIMAESEGLLF